MISQTDLNNNAAYDVKGMDGLRQSAKAQDPGALKEAATQFEAMFINMMMKTMRDATPQDGIMDSQQSKMYTSMLDQQTSQSLAKRGTGLADALLRQLSASQPLATDATEVPSPRSSSMAQALAAFRQQQNAVSDGATANTNAKTGATQAPHVRAFQEKLGAHAEEASRATGIPAKFMLGQAALETGWGKREIIGRDGSSSHNLFGIKATPDWKGKVTQAVTTEYVNGKPQTRVENFRAYDSYADSFKDYAQLITGNKRYEKVLASAGDASSFAQGLQKAGYATDPNYAAKLTKIIKHSLVG
ncbi:MULTISPECIES: flagellar assembly peptidoglycan hydrolase FlgJ [unclassified Janthinobacterium]|uniref:flagellar assembly peptidoglycan hydrolase FlgJ n=1 Tax=unclassified Janthinobacterium TaxID=2610881 RepID=UPI001614D076|nr:MULTISPECIES: flagellar assembly peptidoglycan hydrolase FlgJ [unclassified Janthinobacterium]MBB5367493.1 flagellar protein FlgJ [Janthinobacterium sp. K2C7]MBB5380029.1 flagellar protein FlgJ [Janthinobacterium sp. K2Li3]MBB5385875.1 flagellar protein FlgJ [Janthinobacterium sp. K2E3]